MGVRQKEIRRHTNNQASRPKLEGVGQEDLDRLISRCGAALDVSSRFAEHVMEVFACSGQYDSMRVESVLVLGWSASSDSEDDVREKPVLAKSIE